MNKNTETRVKVSDEYDSFNLASGNRGISPAHVKELRKSIENVGLIPAPIIVNEKMEIVDGQHRFMACQMLNKPIYYIVINGIGMEQTVAMNANNKNWTSLDYLNYYAGEMNADYVFIKRMNDQSSLSLSTILHILNGGTVDGAHYMDLFKSGRYKVNEDMANAQKLIEWLENFVPHIKNIRGRKTSVILALAWIKRNFEVDDERMQNVIKDIGIEDVPIADTKTAMQSIEERYNRRLGKDNKRYFVHEYEVRK